MSGCGGTSDWGLGKEGNRVGERETRGSGGGVKGGDGEMGNWGIGDRLNVTFSYFTLRLLTGGVRKGAWQGHSPLVVKCGNAFGVHFGADSPLVACAAHAGICRVMPDAMQFGVHAAAPSSSTLTPYLTTR